MTLIRFLSLIAVAQAMMVAQNFTTISASKIQDASGAPLASGQLCVQGVDSSGRKISYQAGGGGIVHTLPVCTTVTSGAISALQVANSSLTLPVNVGYTLTITDNTSGAVISTLGPTQITGTNWSLDAYQPSVATALVQQGPKGDTGAAAVVTSNGSNGDFAVGGNLSYAKLDGSVSMSVKSPRFGAVGDNSTDDTTALQACFDWAGANRGSCYLPPAIYKVTGSGLTLPGSATVRSDGPLGQGTAELRYYGTGTALRVGTGSGSFVYAATLQNVYVTVAAGVTAQYGINITGLSEAHWYGVGVSGNSTGGKFTTSLRFSDTNGLTIDGLTMSNAVGSAYTGTTMILYDEVGGLGYGNNSITINHADLYFAGKFFDVKSCDACRVLDSINLEGFDYLVNIDTAGTTQSGNFVSFRFENNTIAATQSAYFSNRKAANINAAGSRPIYLYGLNFTGNVMQFSGGVTNPMMLTVSSSASPYIINFQMDNNILRGANGAVVGVSSTYPFARLRFGWNYAYSNTATVRTPDVVSYATGATYLLDEAYPQNSTGQALSFHDLNGTEYLAGSSGNSMSRPASGSLIPGAIYGVDVGLAGNNNGFLRTGTFGGSLPSSYATYCDYSGSSSLTDMNHTIVCFVGNVEQLRMDGSGSVKVPALTSTGSVVASGYNAGGSTGVSVSCSGGQTAKPTAISGGIVTAASCAP